MKCPECHAENADEAEYCSLCYARFRDLNKTLEHEKVVQRIYEKHPGSKIGCPNCGEVSPVESQFCLKCGYLFDDIESLLVSEEEMSRIKQEKEIARERELEVLLSAPITITAESDGVEIMRNLEDILKKGYSARIHTHGRNATTYAMKIIALMSEDLRKQEKGMFFRASLITEGVIIDLEDVELEIVLEMD